VNIAKHADPDQLRSALQQYKNEHEVHGKVYPPAVFDARVDRTLGEPKVTWVLAVALGCIFFSFVASFVPTNVNWLLTVVAAFVIGIGFALAAITTVGRWMRRDSAPDKMALFSKRQD